MEKSKFSIHYRYVFGALYSILNIECLQRVPGYFLSSLSGVLNDETGLDIDGGQTRSGGISHLLGLLLTSLFCFHFSLHNEVFRNNILTPKINTLSVSFRLQKATRHILTLWFFL